MPVVLAEDRRVPLRLTATRGELGLELYEPVEIGPLTVTKLEVSLPGLKFPIDLSGGVPKFRHRRGRLERLRLELELGALEGFAARALGEVLGSLSRPPAAWPLSNGFGLGFVSHSAALAFDLLWVPAHGDARFVIDNARGVGFELPALGIALRVGDTLMAGLGERQGRVLSVSGVGRLLGRWLLPAVGARAPRAAEVRFGPLQQSERRFAVELDAAAAPPDLGFRAARALELSALVSAADDALAAGEVDAAREGYVTALERAPRHPELSRMIAEIDARIGGRREAALGLLVESLPATQAGLVGAELLAGVGDHTGARDAIQAAVRHEVFAPLSALSWCRLAELETEAYQRAQALDRAVAQAPGLPAVRWARFEQRLARGDVDGAVTDAEHLEASASGARARHDVCRKAARKLLDAGFQAKAGRVFERALRYVPDDAAATAGLARALVLAGRPERALPLLERALELSERGGTLDADALLDLAKILAEQAGDLPQAIARARAVPAASPRLAEARYLEAVWRARLGDRVGATLAFGRLREAVELTRAPEPAWGAWLVEAADNALHVDRDPAAAERHLASALRILPHDESLAGRYREVAGLLAERDRARS
jgi:tetratricopeptide (TPR) repeat protein